VASVFGVVDCGDETDIRYLVGVLMRTANFNGADKLALSLDRVVEHL